MSELNKEGYTTCLNYDKCISPIVKKCFEQLINEHFELKEKYSKILDDCHDYRHETHAIKMTVRNLMEHFGVTSIEELKNIYLNKPYKFEELKVGMHCYVFVNTEVPIFNMKVDALITKICDNKKIECIFVEANGVVVYKRIPFKENRFYPREVKANEV